MEKLGNSKTNRNSTKRKWDGEREREIKSERDRKISLGFKNI